MKTLLFSLITALSSLALAIPSQLTTCENREDLMVESNFTIVGDQFSAISKDLKKPSQAPDHNTGTIIGESIFKESDLDKENLEFFLKVIGIKSFKPSKVLDVQVSGASKPSSYAFLEHKTKQYAVVWIVGGFFIPLGRTDIKCK